MSAFEEQSIVARDPPGVAGVVPTLAVEAWGGSWVGERTGIRMIPTAGADHRDLVGLALRRNPRRVQHVVSTVLGKHVPASPERVLEAADLLGAAVRALDPQGSVVVLGFAETATALGFRVADWIPGAWYAHSTRSPVRAPAVSFVEEHSHAPSHYLAPTDITALRNAATIVLVDDEISTGRTAINVVRAILAETECRSFVLASLVDSRSDDDRAELMQAAAALGVRMAVVALSEVRLDLPAEAAARAEPLLTPRPTRPAPTGIARITTVPVGWPDGLPLDAHDGVTASERGCVARAAAAIAQRVASGIEPGCRVLVVGVEEFMTVPVLVAEALAHAAFCVRVCSTTRSPVVAVDEDGYAVRTSLAFEGDAGQERYARFLYNVPPGEYPVIVVVAPATGPNSASRDLLEVVAAGNRAVHSVRIGAPA